MKPVIKWVGGKRQLLEQFQDLYPNFDTYIEPFVGAGAVFFDIQKFNPTKTIINDLNEDLINLYLDIKNNSSNLISKLQEVQTQYNKSKDKEQFFKDKRQEFNVTRESELFIFLNKTCFNGMYRVNKSGGFNTPYNKTYTNLNIDFENIKKVSETLKTTIITYGDYKNIIDYVDENTFIYLDPPYRVLTNNFTTYTKEGFNEESQIELSEFVKELSNKRAKVMLSNSYSDDGFFEKYYDGFNFHFVNARRSVNSDGKGRGKVREIVITNYLPKR